MLNPSLTDLPAGVFACSHIHQAFGHELHHLAQHINIRALFSELVGAIVAVVIVFPLVRLLGRTSTPTLSETHNGHPNTDGPRFMNQSLRKRLLLHLAS